MAQSKKNSKKKSRNGESAIRIIHPRSNILLPPIFQVIGWVSSSNEGVTIILENKTDQLEPVQPPTVLSDGWWSANFSNVPTGTYHLTCATGENNKTTAQLNVTVFDSVIFSEVTIDHPLAGDIVLKRFQASGQVDPSVSELVFQLNGNPVNPKSVSVPGDGSWSATFDVQPGTYNLKVCIADTDTCAQHNDITVVLKLGYPQTHTISITSPAAGSKVALPFKVTGSVAPPNSSVTITLNGNSISANVPGDGSWSGTFQNITPGIYSITATIDGSTTSVTIFNITVDP